MMMKSRQSLAAVTLAALLLTSCGGGGDSSLGSGGPVTVTPTPSPTPAPTANCALAARQSFAKAVIDEWYLFPGDVAVGVNPASFGDVQSDLDALVAPARALNTDRFFTYITSIAEENAFFSADSRAVLNASGRASWAPACDGAADAPRRYPPAASPTVTTAAATTTPNNFSSGFISIERYGKKRA